MARRSQLAGQGRLSCLTLDGTHRGRHPGRSPSDTLVSREFIRCVLHRSQSARLTPSRWCSRSIDEHRTLPSSKSPDLRAQGERDKVARKARTVAMHDDNARDVPSSPAAHRLCQDEAAVEDPPGSVDLRPGVSGPKGCLKSFRARPRRRFPPPGSFLGGGVTLYSIREIRDRFEDATAVRRGYQITPPGEILSCQWQIGMNPVGVSLSRGK